MKILLAASEMAPLARTGGLGDLLEKLPVALAAAGHEVSVVLPCYRGLREDAKLDAVGTGVAVPIQIGGKVHVAEILQATAPNGTQVFLVRRDEYFDRAGFYGENGADYGDNAERFIWFSKAVVELSRRLVPGPDIVHVHDWQTALVPVLLKDRRLPFRSVLTIHDVAFQGSFRAHDFGLTNLHSSYFGARGVEFYGSLNLLKGGILFADQVMTVSEHYAHKIQTPEVGSGLDVVLRENAGKLSGVLSGVDPSIWDPAVDAHLRKPFSANDLSGKKDAREAVLKACGLEPAPRGPVFAMIAPAPRPAATSLLIPLLDRLLADDVRLVILGEGNPADERELLIAGKRHFGRFSHRTAFSDALLHQLIAGADVLLSPSHLEPSGIKPMCSLKYGTLPVALAEIGCYEIVRDDDGLGIGFVFHGETTDALWDAITEARRCFGHRESWEERMRLAMQCDFSWNRAVQKYADVYRRVLQGVG